MNQKIKSLVELAFVILFSFIFYIYAFDIRTLNTSNISWLLAGDPAQHYFGWTFFRFDAWRWPLGFIEPFNTPMGASIVFTDSIPILALCFKSISFFLPNKFQYFGIWMLSCYILSGFFGYKLIGLVTSNSCLRILGATLFILSPPLLFRGSGHEALMGHWLILAGIYGYISNWNFKRWIFLIAFSVLVHPYIFVMVFGIYLSSVAKLSLVINKKIKLHSILEILIIIVISTIIIWQAGYLIDIGEKNNEGYGYFSMNLLSYFDPIFDGSLFLKQNHYHEHFMPYGQYEGMQFIGFGMSIALISSVTIVFLRGNIPPILSIRECWPLYMVALVFAMLALSNKVMLGSINIFTIPLPNYLVDLLSFFRSSGRFGWILFYVIYFYVISVIISNFNYKFSIPFLIFIISIQFIDQMYVYKRNKSQISERMSWVTPLKDPRWDLMAQNNKQLILISKSSFEKEYIPFAYLASRYQLSTNASHLARSNQVNREFYSKKISIDFMGDNSELSDTIFVFVDKKINSIPVNMVKKLKFLDSYPVFCSKCDYE